MERFYPLHALVCDRCWLVQLQEFVAPADIFPSTPTSRRTPIPGWRARRYADKICTQYGIGPGSLVVEIAGNDGYLLQHFVARDVPVVGIEPAATVAQVAIDKGVRSEVLFFGRETAERIAKKYGYADLRFDILTGYALPGAAGRRPSGVTIIPARAAPGAARKRPPVVVTNHAVRFQPVRRNAASDGTLLIRMWHRQRSYPCSASEWQTSRMSASPRPRRRKRG